MGRLTQSSTVSRYRKELLDTGIVAKSQTPGGKVVFAIADEYRERIAFAFRQIVGKT